MPSTLKRIFVRNGRLHPAWRAFLFLITFALVTIATQALVGVAYIILRYSFTGGPVQLPPEEFLRPSPLMTLMMLTGFLSTLAVTFLFRRLLDGKTLRSLGFERRPGWQREIAFGLVIGAALMEGVFLIQWIAGWLSVQGFTPPAQALTALLWMTPGLIPAAAQEELVFRGYFFQNLREAFGTVAAVALSSLLFGLFHGANPNVTWLALVNLVLAGLLFAVAYIVTGNLWLPIALHFAWNFFEGPVLGFPVSGMKMGGFLALSVTGPAFVTGGPFGPEGGLSGTFLTLLGLGILLLLRKRLTPHPEGTNNASQD